MRISIIGDGQMGLVLAAALVEADHDVRLWGPFPKEVELLGETRESPLRLPGFRLPDEVEVIADDRDALDGAEYLLNAIPTQFMRAVWTRLRAAPNVPVLSVSKGIENDTLLSPTQIIADVRGGAWNRPAAQHMCALSGPTIAAELARRLPATMVAASDDEEVSRAAQKLFTSSWLRIYAHGDLIGVELAGATKNVIALAAGMVDGLEAGDNAKSALLARGLAEIARLGVTLGAKLDTFFGVAGVGDLATTCFSPSGRNRACGERIARGESLDAILASTPSIVEGVPTTRSVMALARANDVEMPITAAVHEILFGGLDPREAIKSLMTRAPKVEQVG